MTLLITVLCILLLQALVVVCDSLMDTIKHHASYRTLFLRRWKWHHLKPSTFRAKLYRWFIAG